jgi:addiction module RelE/StbE family toxin
VSPKKRSRPASLAIRWSDRAKADLVSIGDFIARDNSAAAQRWVAKLIDTVEKAAKMPLVGRVVPEFHRVDLRELIQGNYRVVYQAGAKVIDVLTIFEGHRLFPDGVVDH